MRQLYNNTSFDALASKAIVSNRVLVPSYMKKLYVRKGQTLKIECKGKIIIIGERALLFNDLLSVLIAISVIIIIIYMAGCNVPCIRVLYINLPFCP